MSHALRLLLQAAAPAAELAAGGGGSGGGSTPVRLYTTADPSSVGTGKCQCPMVQGMASGLGQTTAAQRLLCWLQLPNPIAIAQLSLLVLLGQQPAPATQRNRSLMHLGRGYTSDDTHHCCGGGRGGGRPLHPHRLFGRRARVRGEGPA